MPPPPFAEKGKEEEEAVEGPKGLNALRIPTCVCRLMSVVCVRERERET